MNINGIQLEVRKIAGPSGPAPLIFLHEGLGSVSLWTQRGLDWTQAVCSATGRAGVVYSRRGYGQSEPAGSGDESSGDYARHGRGKGSRPARLAPDYMHREAWEVLQALLHELQIEKPVLLGHSDGATIALLYTSRHPVSACITMAPHVLVEEIAIQAITQARVAFEAGGLRERLARYHADIDGAFWQWNEVWLSAGFRSFDIRAECRRVTAPLLLIQGFNDEYGTLRQLDEIALAAPHAVQLRLANCGHSPHRDHPEKTLEAVAAFLQNVA